MSAVDYQGDICVLATYSLVDLEISQLPAKDMHALSVKVELYCKYILCDVIK